MSLVHHCIMDTQRSGRVGKTLEIKWVSGVFEWEQEKEEIGLNMQRCMVQRGTYGWSETHLEVCCKEDTLILG